MQTITRLVALSFIVPLLGASCQHDEPGANSRNGTVYVQYERLGDGFRELQPAFTLTDYVFREEPIRPDWSADTNENYIDKGKIAELVKAGQVKQTLVQKKGDGPLSLEPGYHLLSDGGPNPVGFWVNATDRPLIWVNSNYPFSCDHAEVKIILKNYPARYNLKWWFMGTDLIDPATTTEQLLTKFTEDKDGIDYDAGFTAMTRRGRSFRVPKGIGYLIVKTPRDTYQAARINVGEAKTTTVTFTAP
ncbi:hypothetical protein M0L20_28590 [Spirosoma sp. RP8]|uniref:Uncharacterized protein n=1 Tax=Spirosoma liriopis TaxID=2937440 RepID=A0ABT0HUG5_9BACT|nr:hypothetical protein [Spirosoma liriopis]MCK8495858.1 hypothetical protein [Spirosoma liriopis]